MWALLELSPEAAPFTRAWPPFCGTRRRCACSFPSTGRLPVSRAVSSPGRSAQAARIIRATAGNTETRERRALVFMDHGSSSLDSVHARVGGSRREDARRCPALIPRARRAPQRRFGERDHHARRAWARAVSAPTRRAPASLLGLGGRAGSGLHGGAAGLFLDVELDATVPLAALVGVVVGDGALGAEALGGEAAGVDAVLAEVLEHGVRAVVRELLVELVGAAVVGVPLDGQDLDLRVDLEEPHHLVEDREALGQDLGPARGELDDLEDLDLGRPRDAPD